MVAIAPGAAVAGVPAALPGAGVAPFPNMKCFLGVGVAAAPAVAPDVVPADVVPVDRDPSFDWRPPAAVACDWQRYLPALVLPKYLSPLTW